MRMDSRWHGLTAHGLNDDCPHCQACMEDLWERMHYGGATIREFAPFLTLKIEWIETFESYRRAHDGR